MTAWLLLALALATAVPAAHSTHVQQTAPQAGALDRLFAGRAAGQVHEALRAGDGDVSLPDPVMPGARAFAGDLLGRLANTVCRSDLIVVGRWTAATPRLTSDASSIYTEWRVELDEVLKARRLEAARGSASTIYVRGGAMRFGARTVTVANRDFARGLEAGATFLVFAARVPDSDALVATAGFRIEGGQLHQASARSRYPDLEGAGRDAGLATVRDMIARTSGNPDCAGRP